MASLEELERRIEALESAGGDDAGYPSFIRVAPDGTITYDFTGHISADGIDFKETDGVTAADDGSIRWLRGGETVARFADFLNTTAAPDLRTGIIRVGNEDSSDGTDTVLYLDASSQQLAHKAYLVALATASLESVGAVVTNGTDPGAPYNRTILETDTVGEAKSSFMGYAADGSECVSNSGVALIGCGGVNSANSAAIPHGLGGVPDRIYLTPGLVSAGTWTGAQYFNVGAVNFTINIFNRDAVNYPGGSFCGVSWYAMRAA